MPDAKFDLGDYVEVKDRIKLFYELFGQGRLVTERVELTREPDDKPKVIVYALAYRTPDDPHPGTGTSWLYLPGATSYTKGSEVENAETSAWGRAIGSLGILIDRSIASGNEIRAKAEDEKPTTNGGLIGTAEKNDKMTSDYNLRMSPEGAFLGFRVKDGVGPGVLVEAHGDLAAALALVEAEVIGQRVQVWGSWVEHPLAKGGKWRAIAIDRIATPSFVLPSTVEASGGLPSETEVVAGSAREADPAAPDEIDALPLFQDVA